MISVFNSCDLQGKDNRLLQLALFAISVFELLIEVLIPINEAGGD